MNYTLINNDSLLALEELEENSIDSIVTDPPYELNFMNKGWDNAGISFNKEIWQKCFRVLKPGGYLLAFGGSRTFHRIAVAIEDAGFEIRDTIMWLYGSGFPKSMNIGLAIDKKNGIESKIIGKSKSGRTSKAFNLNDQQREAGTGILAGEYELKEAQNEWKGWGTALKPSFEPIIVARKPFKGSLVDNVIENGVGGINIDECRVGNEELHNSYAGNKNSGFTSGDERDEKGKAMFSGKKQGETIVNGRFPANTILTYDETDFDEVCGGFPNTKNSKRSSKYNKDTEYTNTYTPSKAIYTENNTYGDSGSASRYFYCAKASKKDRDEGLEEFDYKIECDRNPELESANVPMNRSANPRKNIHPTVKPTTLMQYLIRLVTPKGGTILDPFMGSGSTGKAAMYENKERESNYIFIGIEKEKEYCEIAKARINYVIRQGEINGSII